MAVATIELSTAAMNVAIRQAASTSLRRPKVECATVSGAVVVGNPSSGTGQPRYSWDAAGFLSPSPAADNLHDGKPAVLSWHRTHGGDRHIA
jgi:hypothetical protein